MGPSKILNWVYWFNSKTTLSDETLGPDRSLSLSQSSTDTVTCCSALTWGAGALEQATAAVAVTIDGVSVAMELSVFNRPISYLTRDALPEIVQMGIRTFLTLILSGLTLLLPAHVGPPC